MGKMTNTRTKKTPSRGRGFILRYLLSLLFGWVFVVVLIDMIMYVVTSMSLGGFTSGIGYGPWWWSSSSLGFYFADHLALLLTALVVFGTLHLLLAYSVDKRFALDKGAEKYVKVFGTIYNAGLALMAVGFAMIALYPLLGTITGLDRWEGSSLAETVVVSVVAILLLLVMIGYKVRMFSRWPRWAYPVVMGGVGIVTIILFLVFPVMDMRVTEKDRIILGDLYSIDGAIYDYVEDNGRLPSGLDVLGLTDLDRDISKYEFRLGSNYYDGAGQHREFAYILCTDGFAGSDNGVVGGWGGFMDYTRGYNCFDLWLGFRED